MGDTTKAAWPISVHFVTGDQNTSVARLDPRVYLSHLEAHSFQASDTVVAKHSPEALLALLARPESIMVCRAI